jgi:hypothetical protein
MALIIQRIYIDGIGFKLRFRADIDIGHMSFGNTGRSIGQQFYTDMDFKTNHII